MIYRTKDAFFAEMRRKYERSWYSRFNIQDDRPRKWQLHDQMAIGINNEIWQKSLRSETHINRYDTRVT